MLIKSIISKVVLGLLLVGMLSSCATVSLKETWRDPEASAATYKKLLVIAVSPNKSLRQSLENIFAETLRDHGVAAISSHTLISDLSKADRAKIQDLAQQSGADAVVITRVLSKSEHTSYRLATGHVQHRTVVMKPNSSTTIAMSAVGIVSGEMDSVGATLETRFFDSASAKLVWSALSSAGGPDNERIDVCWKLSALLTKALNKEALIEINSKEFHQPSL